MAMRLLLLSLLSAALPNGTLSEIGTLPTYVVPSHYSISLELDPNNATYEGFVEISFSAGEALYDIIKLHASPETIDIQYVLLNYDHSCTVTDHDDVTDIVTLTCPSKSFQLKNTLMIRFQGKVSTEESYGLYRSTYEEEEEEHLLLSTQFGALGARRAFPCLDEPKWKTTFDISITLPSNYTALANTKAIKQSSIA